MKFDWRIKAAVGCAVAAAIGSAVLSSGVLDSLDASAERRTVARVQQGLDAQYDALRQQYQAHPVATWEMIFRGAQR